MYTYSTRYNICLRVNIVNNARNKAKGIVVILLLSLYHRFEETRTGVAINNYNRT
jgi:hypothetical protein